jgi:hypothetical protein
LIYYLAQTNGVEEDTTNTEPTSQKSDLERYWEIVKANPDVINSLH